MRLPEITAHPDPKELITPGKSVRFTVTATGYKPSYQWRKNGDDIPGETSDTYSIKDVTASHEGHYSCVVSNGAGSVSSTCANLTLGKYFSSVSAYCH